MARCWEQRGCDEEMQADCPHPNELQDRCPTKCAFAQCDRPTHELTVDPELIFDPSVDRDVAIREECLYCAFFLRRAPRIPGYGSAGSTDSVDLADVLPE